MQARPAHISGKAGVGWGGAAASLQLSSERERTVTPTITVFRNSPDEGQGQARDTRVRWALEELGLPYDVATVSFEEMRHPTYKARQPFGQIPLYEEGDLVLFESGAIVLHLAQNHPGLLPQEPNARARAAMWVFAALATIEPPIVEREQVDYVESDRSWYAARLPLLDDRIRTRLRDLAARLGDAEWLDGPFTAGDLMMVMVLRRMNGSALLREFATLSAYVARGEARPAFQRAFAAQRALFLEQSGN